MHNYLPKQWTFTELRNAEMSKNGELIAKKLVSNFRDCGPHGTFKFCPNNSLECTPRKHASLAAFRNVDPPLSCDANNDAHYGCDCVIKMLDGNCTTIPLCTALALAPR